MQRFVLAVLVLALAVAAAACSTDEAAGECADIAVENAWVRLPPGENTAFYFDATNGGDADSALIGASSEIAGTVELHETEMVEGKMEMKPVPNQQVPLPVGETVSFEPGGLHVMVMGLTTDLKEGDEVDFSLTFSDECTKDIKAPVEAFTQ
jgi:copper(I)-binding protein